MRHDDTREGWPVVTRFVAAQGLRVVDFEEESIVFHPLTWDAHLLNPSASAVLGLFLQGPQSEREVEAFLTEALLPAERVQAGQHAQNLVSDLTTLGLIHAIDR